MMVLILLLMKRKLLVSAAMLAAALAFPAAAQPAHNPTVIIVELQTASLESASDEFVEIYNPELQPQDLEGWKLQYKSASGATWQTKAELAGTMLGRSRLLIATEAYDSSLLMAGGFAAAGGHLQIVDGSDNSIDLVGWGTASQPEGQAAEAHAKGQSLKRLVDEDGFFLDTSDNSADFFVSENPSPQFDGQPAPPEEEPGPPIDEPDEAGVNEPAEPPQNDPETSYQKITITELFIDPTKPLTDAEDEFVELFNPNPPFILGSRFG